MAVKKVVILCPGQGAQAVGMGSDWANASPAAKAVFDEADEVLGDSLGESLSTICFSGPPDRLNQTDVSQPAIYTCSVASYRGIIEREGDMAIVTAAGLSLGEYTALHLAGVFGFADGLRLVARRGRVMQEACEASQSGMVALIGADEQQAEEVCMRVAEGQVLVSANFNAPGQVVLSGHVEACQRAVSFASDLGLRATILTVAGAFHSPLMQSAADKMAEALAGIAFNPPDFPIWSNVTAEPHDAENPEHIKHKLVQQIVSPVKWAQCCCQLVTEEEHEYHELAPGTVLRGLMRRIDRSVKVSSHDGP